MTGKPERPPSAQLALDTLLRDAASREQAKQRRLNAAAKLPRRPITLKELPLFADEQSLSEAILGPGKYSHWRAVVALLERRGFPTIDGLMGGRYCPAVKAFFDGEYDVQGASQVSAPHTPAALGTWKSKTRLKAKK